MDLHKHPGRGPVQEELAVDVIVETRIVLAAERFSLFEETAQLLHEGAVLHQVIAPDLFGQFDESFVIFENIDVNYFLFSKEKELVEYVPETVRVRPR
jgi:hypothetical protein